MSVSNEQLNPPHVGDMFCGSLFSVDVLIALCFLCGYRMLYFELVVFSRVFLYNVVQDVPFVCYLLVTYYFWWVHILFCLSFVFGHNVTLYAFGMTTFAQFVVQCTVYLLPLALCKMLDDFLCLWNIGLFINTWLDDNWYRFSWSGLFYLLRVYCVSFVCGFVTFSSIYCLMVVVNSRE